MKANNVFESAILNGTGSWIGRASLASSSDRGRFSMPDNRIDIKRLLDGLKIEYKSRYSKSDRNDAGFSYHLVGLPKEFLAVLIDPVSCESVGTLGLLYGGFPSIFNYQPKNFRIHCIFRKNELSQYYCEEFTIWFWYPYTPKSKSTCSVRFTRLPYDKDRVGKWRAEIRFEINVVNSYFYRKNPELFGN